MAAKITKDVLESHLRCKYKSHIKLAGQQGSKSDYECMLAESREEVRRQTIEKILAKHADSEVARNVPLIAAELRKGAGYVLDASLEDEVLSLRFDGLKKVVGGSKLRDFHYVPVLFHEGRQVGKQQRLLLELYGLLLSRVQERTPDHGVVWHGRECKATRVRLNRDVRKTEQLLREVKELAGSASPPKWILNDHCHVCEFRQRCQQQAIQEDNLSLLRGMSEKEVKAYSRKGILTLTQLAHTFRPRRKGKRRTQKNHRRYHALQALAVRDKKVYVFGTPELPEGPGRIYLDMEGDPDEGYVYLIGMIAVVGGAETRCSFWADTKEQEPAIFEQLMAEMGKYDDFLVYCYGGYEQVGGDEGRGVEAEADRLQPGRLRGSEEGDGAGLCRQGRRAPCRRDGHGRGRPSGHPCAGD